MDYISLSELCNKLSISNATGKNWLKLGKLAPDSIENNIPYFSQEHVENIKKELLSGENVALKSRRNKKYVSGNSLYNSYVSEQCQNLDSLKKLLAMIAAKGIEPDSTTIRLFVAECALHLFCSKQNSPFSKMNNLLLHFLSGKLSVGEYDELILGLIDDSGNALSYCKANPLLFSINYVYESKEDILGLIYISCQNIGNRKAEGSYYTPTRVVKALIGMLDFKEGERILDPCCGTGNFLLQLPATIAFESVYGNDLDTVSTRIARINMALKYNVSVELIKAHITEYNYLTAYEATGFKYIIGNPPWGYDFSKEEKTELKKIFKSSSGENIESYDVFIEQAIRSLESNGHLAFVLPEAILNVKAHTNIRSIIQQSGSIKNLSFLGNAFDGVQCPCIIVDFQLTRTPLSTNGLKVITDNGSFTINTERDITPDNFSFTLTDEEYLIIKKLRDNDNIAYLAGNADFALGIVTGNNKEKITDVPTAENEIILKGSDICKYHIKPCSNYIVFAPESFQQTAPTEMYRAKEKLLYRFISNRFIFAYDDKQTLSLNSCNIVIPRIPGAKMKYVLAILNSRVAQFIYKREFNSVKVLRAHIEAIPIPLVAEDIQDKIIGITERLIEGLAIDEAEAVYEELDGELAALFKLTPSEYEQIKSVVDVDSNYLS